MALHVHEAGGAAHVDQVGRRAVGAERHRTDAAGPVRGPDHHGSGSIPEQRRGAAVVGVDEAGHQIGADHEHVARPAGLHLAGGQRQPGEEAAAGGAHVERSGPGGAERARHQRSGVGQQIVLAHGGHDHEVEVGGVEPGAA